MGIARRLLIPGLLLGALVRAAALPAAGTGDVGIWKVWSFGARYDLTGVYGAGGSPPERRILHWQGVETTVNYPPIALAELALAGRLYEVFHPLYEDSPALNAAVKLPALAAEVVLVALALTWGRRRFGPDRAAWTALAIALNPAMLLAGPVLGYIDGAMAVPAVLALAAAWAGAGWLAGVLVAVAVLTKPQALFVCPVIAAVAWARARRRRVALEAAAGGALTCAVVLVPYVVRGAWPNFLQAMSRLGAQDMLSAHAANVWWIFTWVLRVVDAAPVWGWHEALTQELRILGISRAVALGYPNARVVGALLVVTAAAWGAWRARRVASLGDLAALAGWSAFAYAQLAAQVHENHLYLALPFLTIAAGLEARYRSVLYAVSAVFALNLLLFYGLGRGLTPPLDRMWTGIDASVLLAFASVGVFVWSTTRVGEKRFTNHSQPTAGN